MPRRAAIKNAMPTTKQIVEKIFSKDRVLILFLILIAISATLKNYTKYILFVKYYT